MARKLDDWLDGYLRFTHNTEPPYLYRVWVGLSAISSVLQRKCSIKMGLLETFPNLFVALVGPSGAGKSRSMSVARDMLREVGVKISAQRITNEALIREMKMAFIDEPDKTGAIFSHSSFTVHASELAVFLGHQNNELLSDLCDLYDCDKKWEYKTKDPSRADEVIKPYLNIIGGITPTLLQSRLPVEAIGGGLTSRMICIYEEKPDKLVPISSISPDEKVLQESLIDDLFAMKSMRGKFILDKSFIDIWVDWYVKAREHPPFDQAQFEGYCSRRPLHVLKMCMLLSASRGGDMTINDVDFKRAVGILQSTEKNMSRTFEGVGESRTSHILTSLMRFIARYKEVPISEIHKSFFNEADKKTIEEMLKQLVAMKYCKWMLETGTIIYTDKEETTPTQHH